LLAAHWPAEAEAQATAAAKAGTQEHAAIYGFLLPPEQRFHSTLIA
jgi:hypothetical protein